MREGAGGSILKCPERNEKTPLGSGAKKHSLAGDTLNYESNPNIPKNVQIGKLFCL